MKINLLTIALASLFIVLTSCGKDDYDIYTEQENHTPTTIEVSSALTYGLRQSDFITNTTGQGHKSSNVYHVGSKDMDVQCTAGGAIEWNFDGLGEYFHFLFAVNDVDTIVLFYGFEAEIDGENVFANDALIPEECQNDRIRVEFEETEDRLFGTFKGEFFTFADEIVSPIDSCVNYRSLGFLEASFNVDLTICD